MPGRAHRRGGTQAERPGSRDDPDLVEFGDSTDTSKSHIRLLEIGDYTNSIDRLYPIPAKAYP